MTVGLWSLDNVTVVESVVVLVSVVVLCERLEVEVVDENMISEVRKGFVDEEKLLDDEATVDVAFAVGDIDAGLTARVDLPLAPELMCSGGEAPDGY